MSERDSKKGAEEREEQRGRRFGRSDPPRPRLQLDPPVADHQPRCKVVNGDLSTEEEEACQREPKSAFGLRKREVAEGKDAAELTVERDLRGVSEENLGRHVLGKVGDEARRDLSFAEQDGALRTRERSVSGAERGGRRMELTGCKKTLSDWSKSLTSLASWSLRREPCCICSNLALGWKGKDGRKKRVRTRRFEKEERVRGERRTFWILAMRGKRPPRMICF